MENIRLLLVDYHALSRECLGRLLAAEPDFEMVGQCGTGEEALGVLNRAPVDVILLDFNLGRDHGNQFILSSREQGFAGTILIVTGAIDDAEKVLAIETGASGIFLKRNSADMLAKTIRLMAGGCARLDPGVIHQLESAQSRELLTRRERQVLEGVFDGFTNKKIATNIGASEGTVKATLQQLFQKTQVRRRSQLVRAAIERSLVAVTRKSTSA